MAILTASVDSGSHRTPFWIVAIVIALASIEPITHLRLSSLDDGDRLATGLHTADSAIYLHAMSMFESGYYSPYATCKAETGSNSPHFYPAPFHWMYGVLGAVGRALGAGQLVFLGWANGIGALIYLIAVYRFLRVAVPRHASLAFVIWTLAGGIGGIAYVVTGALGLHGSPAFDAQYVRLFMYELVEGPYLNPALHAPRLYYTLSLALGFAALHALLLAAQKGCRKHMGYAAFLLLCSTLVNFRFGCFFCGVTWLYLLTGKRESASLRLLAGSATGIATILGVGVSLAWLSKSSVFAENTGLLVRESLWPTAFAAVACFQLIALMPVVKHATDAMTKPLRSLSSGLIGYLGAYCLLFAAYQIYYGNGLSAGDHAAAVAISDWALLGGILGGLYGYFRQNEEPKSGEAWTWPALWFLLFLAGGVSALGQGWMLQFTPQRLMVFLGVPMAVLTAEGLFRLNLKSPRAARGLFGTMICCGVASLLVAGFAFQGTYHRVPGQGPYLHLHSDLMSAADGELLSFTAQGVVLAPGTFSDVAGLRPGMRVLGGVGAADLSDQLSVKLQPRIDAFFSQEQTSQERGSFLVEWCVGYVYCPDSWPIAPQILAAIRALPEVSEIATSGKGALFRVRPPLPANNL